jgi:hypothetical protein
VKLRQKCGLLGNEPLLRDYEERKDEVGFGGGGAENSWERGAQGLQGGEGGFGKIDYEERKLQYS